MDISPESMLFDPQNFHALEENWNDILEKLIEVWLLWNYDMSHMRDIQNCGQNGILCQPLCVKVWKQAVKSSKLCYPNYRI